MYPPLLGLIKSCMMLLRHLDVCKMKGLDAAFRIESFKNQHPILFASKETLCLKNFANGHATIGLVHNTNISNHCWGGVFRSNTDRVRHQGGFKCIFLLFFCCCVIMGAFS